MVMSIFKQLDRAGLDYSVRFTDHGEPYAGFSWRGGNGPILAFTAMQWRGGTRFSLHEGVVGLDASGRGELTASLDLVCPIAGIDGATDLVVVFPEWVELAGTEVLDLLWHLSATHQWCEKRLGDSPRRPQFPGAARDAAMPVGWTDVVTDIHAGPTPLDQQLIDEVQQRLAVGRLVHGDNGLSLHVAVPFGELGANHRTSIEMLASAGQEICDRSIEW